MTLECLYKPAGQD